MVSLSHEWHGKNRFYKNGQLMLQDKGPDAGKEYGCVTSVEVAMNRDKELLTEFGVIIEQK